MRKPVLSVSFALAAFPLMALAAADQAAVGDWGGALHHGDAAWRVRLHVQAAHDGGLVATASGFPLEPGATPAHVALRGERLSFSTATGEYSGVWNQGKAEWVGTWKQADMSEALALRWDFDGAAGAVRLAQPPVVLTLPDNLPSRVPGELPNIIGPSR